MYKRQDYNISGAGYPYHHCFVRRRLDLRNYDRLWKAFLGMEHEADCALRLAFWRLRYPLDLTPEAEKAYLDYLRAQSEAALALLLEARHRAGAGARRRFDL